MLHRWETLTFLHWSYEPAIVRRLLPPGLEVDEYDERAWVGLVPFRMRIRRPGLPEVPWVSVFPETNVRTYVRGPDGRTGIWFLSLEAARLGAVLAARTLYRLPYMWARMTLEARPDLVRYWSRRRWPGPRGARCAVAVVPGEPIEPGALDHFLTARFRLYGPGLTAVNAEHPPWPLRRARLLALRDELLEAAGLPTPAGPPLVHYSDGVDVRIGTRKPLG